MKNKWIVLISSSLIQLVLGIIYIWGVFEPEVAEHFNWSTAESAAVFSVMIVFIVIGSIVGGKIQDKAGPRPVVLISGLLIGTGAYLAAYSVSPLFMYATYGGLSGLGIGAVYTTTIAVVQKWFKENKSFATGIVLGALGFGGVVFTPVIQYLLESFKVPYTFKFLGIIYLMVCLSGGIFVVNPVIDNKRADSLKGMSNSEMLKTSMYYIVTGTMLLSLPAFFMVSPIVKTLCVQRGISADVSTYVVMGVAILNCSGRFISPILSRGIGEKNTLTVLSLITASASIGMISAHGTWCVLLMGLIGVCFGGFFGIFPGITSAIFGIKNAASNYGFVLIGYGMSALFAPGIYGLAASLGDAYPFLLVALLSAVSIITGRFIKIEYMGKDA